MNKIFLFIIKIIVNTPKYQCPWNETTEKPLILGTKAVVLPVSLVKHPHCLAEGEGYLLVHHGYTYSSL